MTILVTGGAGYIGSHTTLALLLAGFSTTTVPRQNRRGYSARDRVRAPKRAG